MNSTIQKIACPSLSHLAPAQLVSILTRWAKPESNQPIAGRYLNPIWLKNDGQNVIGLFPKKAFYLLPVVQNANMHELQLLTLSRKGLPDFKGMLMAQMPVTSDDTKYDQTKENTTNNHTSVHTDMSDEMLLSLSNVKSIHSFIGQLIRYREDVDNEDINHEEMYKETTNQQLNDFERSDNKNADSQLSDEERAVYRDGFMGFIGYDVMASHLANHIANGQSAFTREYMTPEQPAVYMGHYPLYLSCDKACHAPYQWHLHATTLKMQEILPLVQSWLQMVVKTVRPLIVQPQNLKLESHWSLQQYQSAFQQTQEYLHAGDCYQINLTQAWKGQLKRDALLTHYLPKLDTYTKAPFAGYLNLFNPKYQSHFELLSCSPELFFTFTKASDKTIHIVTKPIKGTRPRGSDVKTDSEMKQQLMDSEKDLAENVMIVDLLRNDLGKYAKTGSVKVPKRFAIESFSNVHHMVSTITATIKDNIHPLEVLFDSLPAGSITGTPKKRAVEIMNELEAEPRGAYCGTMGYMNFDGSGQWNVLIRTLQANNQAVSIWAGGGITVASEAEAEYAECLDKVGNLLDILSSMS